MQYIVPLGNPGEKYVNTRHNVAWFLIDTLLSEIGFSNPVSSARVSGRVASGEWADSPMTVLYPDTFMNHSGVAVAKMVPKDVLASLIVVHDELDLPLGTIKIAFDRGAAGHNGVASIITELGSTAFIRVRVGIAPRLLPEGAPSRPSGEATQQFVLGRFTAPELTFLSTEVYPTFKAVLECLLKEGVTSAMNRFHTSTN